jgi:hypothetical protein
LVEPSQPVGDGEAPAEGEALGSSGWVGVGTGGMVSGGSGSWDASVGAAEGSPVGAAADGPVGIGPTGVETATAGVVKGTTDGPVVSGEVATGAWAGFACRAGASPMPPAPLGASTAAERVAGVASCQPMVTATGSPSATSPKKMDLGDNRT